MQGELVNFLTLWSTALTSACYCYVLSITTTGHGGLLRFLLVVPVAALFAALPFSLSTCHLAGTAFYFLTWLGNSKLLLFSGRAGPLSQPGLSLPQFVCVLLLPIKLRKPGPGSDGSGPGWVLSLVKVVGFGCLVKAYEYEGRLPGFVAPGLYGCHMYLTLEMIFGLSWALARAAVGPGVHLVPQSNHPYLSTSLQDFWGRRWNLMTSDTVKQSVHNPIRAICGPVIGPKWATVAGILGSFAVSGLMHEILYYHYTHKSPTWEVTWFFILHGVCLTAEVAVKAAVSPKWRLSPFVSTPLTLGFMAVTSSWLLFPQLARNRVYDKAVNEYFMLANCVKGKVLY